MEPGNYASLRDYRAESRQVSQDLRDVRRLLDYARWRVTVTTSTSGRLQWDYARGQWDYTTGQYFAVEYRKAAARLLAEKIGRQWLDAFPWWTWRDVQGRARSQFGRRIASRYF
jgi:hypothetical protein